MSIKAELRSVCSHGFAPRRDPVARSGARFCFLDLEAIREPKLLFHPVE